MSTQISTHMSTHISKHVSTHISKHVSTHMSKHVSTHMSKHVSTHMFKHITGQPIFAVHTSLRQVPVGTSVSVCMGPCQLGGRTVVGQAAVGSDEYGWQQVNHIKNDQEVKPRKHVSMH